MKLENILIHSTEGKHFDIRIADFGLSTFIEDENKLLFLKCGTPGYAAPEMLREQGYSYKCDMFSLGVVFFNLLTGKHLFNGNDN